MASASQPWPLLLLDTNACIALLKRRAPELRDRIVALPKDQTATCAIVKAERMFGVAKSDWPDKARAQTEQLLTGLRLIDFTANCADEYGRIRFALERAGQGIGANDALIAATALAHGATLITRNLKEFGRVPGLAVEAW